ncbi:hypothetical protein SAMN05443575_2026 [Jatrophihabitans endophyticus]|uniref:Trypsin-like peptidase domain-containing protein n=1 Tax=Jatrophihabitans endophyticus TaxID=1206085 RepID=A0A1M5IWL0_9ACTN|nr:hypothetical protein [Jatrophihabitans endophyticus]SHG32676.1 hypothetical protein SAMN05443575_2026 [Jatrophihabitans endophyticus]
MRSRVRTTLALLTGAVTAGLLVGPAAASAAPTWAPESSATLHPGVQAYTAGAQCTTNFVFTDSAGAVYLGYAAHCAGTGEATDTDGCQTKSLPLGTAVTFNQGGSLVSEGTKIGSGTLAYSSWSAMQSAGEKDANTCAYNDLALVKVSDADKSAVNPTVPFFGGPNKLGSGTTAGQKIYSYGNSSLRAGVTALSPKFGASLGDTGGGWSTTLYTVTPGIPGDSGSGFLDKNGNALGVLSTVAIAPLPASNGVGNLRKELAYAQAHSGIAGLALVAGTRSFSSTV